MAAEAAIERPAAAGAGGTGTAILATVGLTRDFGGIRALDRCSLRVGRGTITGLIGPNGAGKTTLFNVVTGIYPPQSGEVWFAGSRIDGRRPDQIFRRGLMRTFQIAREMGGMSVIENLMLVPTAQRGECLGWSWLRPGAVRADERALRERAMDVLRFVELDRLAGEPAGNLSTGQKKILELGRAIMAEPAMVLLDEPGAGVNPALMKKLVGYIRELNRRGTTFLLIEHDMELVMSLCRPIVVMNTGKSLAEGSAEEVRKDPRVLEAYLGGA